jgi:hypothetical protein
MYHGKLWLWAEHIVVIDNREPVPRIIHHNLNSLGQERVSWSGSHETIP